MKKVLLVLGVVSTVGMISCGGIDTEAAAKEFCSCSDKEGDAKEKCYDDWVEKYKGAKASEEDAKKMGEEMAKCDLSGAMKVLQKAQE
jgi:hypothetical protein